MISAMQKNGQHKGYLFGKMVLDAAYRQIHANATTTSNCIGILDKLDFFCLRSHIGTTPAPAEYTTINEAAIDIGNDLLRDDYWDTNILNSPHRSLLPKEDKQHS